MFNTKACAILFFGWVIAAGGWAFGASRAVSLTGEWSGDYTYMRYKDEPPLHVQFTARLVQKGNQLEGTTSEIDTFEWDRPESPPRPRVSQLTATLHEGQISGNQVRFRKEYNAPGRKLEPIEYTGVYDAQRRTITGQWVIGDTVGPFTMKWVGQ
jgi:hypothetical protein